MKRPPAIAARRMRGFSLIEMVAAFLVFALGIGVLMQILSSSLRSAKLSADYTMAALWAQSRLDVVGVGERIEPGRSSGRFDDSYSWELDIELVDPAAVEPPPQQVPAGPDGQPGGGASVADAGLGGGLQLAQPFDLYQVDLTVFWGPRGRTRTAHFSTLRVSNPDPNDPFSSANPDAGVAPLPRGAAAAMPPGQPARGQPPGRGGRK